MNSLIFLDINITRFLNSIIPHNEVFDFIFFFFSLYGFSIIIWIILLLFLMVFEEKRNPVFIIYFFITFFVTVLISDWILKDIFQRTRPFVTFSMPSLLCPSNFSFPSTHASTAFASASVFSFFDKKRKFFYYSIAICIGISRIYWYCHYFLDVVIGAGIGLLISNIILISRRRKILHGRL